MKYPIPFTYTAYGEIPVEADSQEEATDKAQELLDSIREAGSMHRSPEIVWDSDEVEVD